MTHRHASDEPGETRNCVEIDEHVCLEPTRHSLVPAGSGIAVNSPEGEAYGDHAYGFLFWHDREGFDVRCGGGVRTCTEHGFAGASWQQTGSLEGGDLTLSPSILCRLGSASVEPCGFHGFVREGKWVPA